MGARGTVSSRKLSLCPLPVRFNVSAMELAANGSAATGEELRARRLAARLTQERLARLARCSTSTVRLVERGWVASPAMARRINRALIKAEGVVATPDE